MTSPAPRPWVLPVDEVAARLLSFIEDAYAAEVAYDDARVDPLPDRRYVAGGGPRDIAWDCDAGQVTVAMGRVFYGVDPLAAQRSQQTPSRPQGHAAQIRQASFEVQIVRPAPGLTETGDLPSGARIGLHGEAFLRDAGFLSSVLNQAATLGALAVRDAGTGQEIRPTRVAVGDMESLGPQGYLAATATTVTVGVL